MKKAESKRTRVLCKFSGEVLSGQARSLWDPEATTFVVNEIISVARSFELAIVIGGGNIVRGHVLKKKLGLNAAVADYVGMVATNLNALILQDLLEKKGLPTRLMTAIAMPGIAEPHIRRRAIRHLEKGRVVIFAGGTGNPFVSTDFAMVSRAGEIDAIRILKGTKVEGIYTKDPQLYKDTEFIRKISYHEYLRRKLTIVDASAIALASEHLLPVVVFNIFKKGNLRRVLESQDIGSIVCDKGGE